MTFSFNLDIDNLSWTVIVGLISYLLIVSGFENLITFGQKCLLLIYLFFCLFISTAKEINNLFV